jgi:hypothetical protein
MMFQIFSVIIETIKDPLLRRLIRPAAQEFRRPPLRHQAGGDTPGHLDLKAVLTLDGSNRFLVRYRSADFGRRHILAQTLVDHLTKQVIVGPCQVFNFGYKLRANPMHAAKHER